MGAGCRAGAWSGSSRWRTERTETGAFIYPSRCYATFRPRLTMPPTGGGEVAQRGEHVDRLGLPSGAEPVRGIRGNDVAVARANQVCLPGDGQLQGPADHIAELLLDVGVLRNHIPIGDVPMHRVQVGAIGDDLEEDPLADIHLGHRLVGPCRARAGSIVNSSGQFIFLP